MKPFKKSLNTHAVLTIDLWSLKSLTQISNANRGPWEWFADYFRAEWGRALAWKGSRKHSISQTHLSCTVRSLRTSGVNRELLDSLSNWPKPHNVDWTNPWPILHSTVSLKHLKVVMAHTTFYMTTFSKINVYCGWVFSLSRTGGLV